MLELDFYTEAWVRERIDRSNSPNFYQRLGIDPSADFETIEKAYNRAVAELHPDRVPADLAKEGLAAISRTSVAFEAIINLHQRLAHNNADAPAIVSLSALATPEMPIVAAKRAALQEVIKYIFSIHPKVTLDPRLNNNITSLCLQSSQFRAVLLQAVDEKLCRRPHSAATINNLGTTLLPRVGRECVEILLKAYLRLLEHKIEVTKKIPDDRLREWTAKNLPPIARAIEITESLGVRAANFKPYIEHANSILMPFAMANARALSVNIWVCLPVYSNESRFLTKSQIVGMVQDELRKFPDINLKLLKGAAYVLNTEYVEGRINPERLTEAIVDLVAARRDQLQYPKNLRLLGEIVLIFKNQILPWNSKELATFDELTRGLRTIGKKSLAQAIQKVFWLSVWIRPLRKLLTYSSRAKTATNFIRGYFLK